MFKYAGDQEIVATTNYATPVELPVREDREIQKPFTREVLWARGSRSLCFTRVCVPPNLRRLNRLVPTAEKMFGIIEHFFFENFYIIH